MKILRRIMRPARAVEDYTEKTFRAISDGVFTAAEAHALTQYAAGIALSIAERHQCHKNAVFQYAQWLARDRDGFTQADESRLSAMMSTLGIRSSADIPGLPELVHFGRIERQIATGVLPVIQTARIPVAVKPSEVVHYCLPIYTIRLKKRTQHGQTWLESVVDKRGYIVIAQSGLYIDLEPGTLTYKQWKDVVEIGPNVLYLRGRANPLEFECDDPFYNEYLDLASEKYQAN